MGDFLTYIASQYGIIGLLIIGVGYLIIDSKKNNKIKQGEYNNTINEVKSLGNKLDNMDIKVNNINNSLSNQINSMQDQIYNMTTNAFKDYHESSNHSKSFVDLLRLGPNLHKYLKEYNIKINSDHIFIGSFHNGNKSITGIPYYKFDIIAERFKLDKVEQDTEFAPLYKDSDLLRFDELPSAIIQNNIMHFVISEDGQTDLKKYDDIIWRRMKGRGIKQLALRVLKDLNNIPSGFVGVVKYDYEKIDINELDLCGHCLEGIYHNNEKK